MSEFGRWLGKENAQNEDSWKTSEIFGGIALGIIFETFAIVFFKFLLWILGGFI